MEISNRANSRIIGIFFIAVAVIIFSTVAYRNSHKAQQPLVYSTTYALNALWASYKRNYVEAATGRTLDPQRNNITTSEGQSYTMLRAVWQDDKETFDRSWQWALQNLKRPNDSLLAWLYGQRSDGSFGTLTESGGDNSASDADSDIALALILASARWHDEAYLTQAKKIINDIWANEVITINGTFYLAANNLEKNSTSEILINPSYLSPYAYKVFAQIDTQNNWNALADSSYEIINKSSGEILNNSQSANLPPNWVMVDRNTGSLKASLKSELDTNYGYDAMRLPFRLALDYQWTNDIRAKQTLEKFGFLGNQWQEKKLLYAVYGHDGSVVSEIEAPAMYGGSFGYFFVVNPKAAEEIYKDKLLGLYSSDKQDWKQPLSYYDSNWAWFGIALYNNRLTNFYQ